METTDKKLIQDFLAGESDSFAILMNRYLKMTYNFIYQIVKDRNVTDDLTQVTFLKVWKSLKKFDQEKKFKTWLFTIAKNTAWDYLKKKKTTPFAFFETTDGYNKLERIADEEKDLEEIISQKELEKELGKKLEKLSDEYRLILLMRYRDGFPVREISDILGKPYNTVKSQHQRALESLKKNGQCGTHLKTEN